MAQNRRRERQRKRKQHTQHIIIAAVCAAAIMISLCACLIILGPVNKDTQNDAAQSALAPFDADTPFSTSDLSAAQLSQIRSDGRMHVSDGPRGISIGDSLDKIIELFPTSYTGEQPDDEQILYCAQVFENQNGKATVLPPRGLLTTDNNSIIVTLLAPTSPYPQGTRDDYGLYEHVYCLFTIEPDSMTVREITLGIDQ